MLRGFSKRSFLDAIAYFISNAISRVPSFVLLPFYAAQLSTGEMGKLISVWMFLHLFQSVASLGMRASIARFLPVSQNELEKTRYLSTTLIITLSGGLLLTLAFVGVYFLGQHFTFFNFLNEFELRLWLLIILAGNLSNIGYTIVIYFRTERKAFHYLGIFITSSVVELGVGFVFVLMEVITLENLLWLECLKSSALFFLTVIYSSKYLSPKFSVNIAKKLLQFGIWTVPLGFFEWVLFFVDRFWLIQSGYMPAVGVYGFLYKFATPMGLLFGGYFMSLDSKLFQLDSAKGTEYARNQMIRFSLVGGLLATIMAWGFPAVFLWIQPYFQNLSTEYVLGLKVYPVFIASQFLHYYAAHFQSSLEHGYRSRSIFISMGTSAVVNFFLTWLFLRYSPAMGLDPIYAVAVASFISIVYMAVLQRFIAKIRESWTGWVIVLFWLILIGLASWFF